MDQNELPRDTFRPELKPRVELHINPAEFLNAMARGNVTPDVEMEVMFDGNPRRMKVLSCREIVEGSGGGRYSLICAPIQDASDAGVADVDKLEEVMVGNGGKVELKALSKLNFESIKRWLNTKDPDYRTRFTWFNRSLGLSAWASMLSRWALLYSNVIDQRFGGVFPPGFMEKLSGIFYPVNQWDKIAGFGVFNFFSLKALERDTKMINFFDRRALKGNLNSSPNGKLLSIYLLYEIQLQGMLQLILGDKLVAMRFDPWDIPAEIAGAVVAQHTVNELIKRIQPARLATINSALGRGMFDKFNDAVELDGPTDVFNCDPSDDEKSKLQFSIFRQTVKDLREITRRELTDIYGSLSSNPQAKQELDNFVSFYTSFFIRRSLFKYLHKQFDEDVQKRWQEKIIRRRSRTSEVMRNYRLLL